MYIKHYCNTTGTVVACVDDKYEDTGRELTHDITNPMYKKAEIIKKYDMKMVITKNKVIHFILNGQMDMSNTDVLKSYIK